MRSIFNRFLHYTCLTLFFVVLASCNSISKSLADTPQVEVTSLGVKELSFNGVVLDLALNIENKNSFAFDVEGVDYILKVNDHVFLDDKYRHTTSIPANSNATLNIPLSVKFSDVRGLFSSMDKLSTIGYKLETVSHVRLPALGVYEVPSEHDGTFKLSDFLRIPL